MNIVNVFLNKPKSYNVISDDVNRVSRLIKSKNLRKSDEKLQEIADYLCKQYNKWDKQTKLLRRRLIEYNELMENVVEDVDFPFEGASNITIGFSSSIGRIFKAAFNRAMFSDPNIFTAVSKDETISKEEIAKAEEALNYSFSIESNGLDTLKTGTIPLYRDGTLIINGYWDRIIERTTDYKRYISAEEFVKDYPSAVDAGISEEEYQSLLDEFILDPQTEINVSFEYDFVSYEGPVYEIIPLARFVFQPLHATSVSQLSMYGSEYFLDEDEIKEKIKRGIFYKKQGEELLQRREVAKKDSWSASRNFIEGLTAKYEEKQPYKLVDCVVKMDLDGDGIREKYFATFSPEHKIVLSFSNYELRKNVDNIVVFRVMEREDRFLGVSLLGENYDRFVLLDTLHRHRNNIRTLVTSPILLANKAHKNDLDFWAEQNLIRPGTVFWVTDVNTSIKQLVLQNLDQPGNSLDEEQLISRYIELSIGPTQALSGRESMTDPRAPMGKTIALLQQANQRIEDYISEYVKSIPDLAKLHSALLAQYGPEKIKYEIEKNGEIVRKELPREIFTRNIKWYSKKKSLTLSPEFSMQRIGGLLQTYMGMIQLLQAGDEIAIELWNRMVVASGEPDRDKLMIKSGQKAGQLQQILSELTQRTQAGGALSSPAGETSSAGT